MILAKVKNVVERASYQVNPRAIIVLGNPKTGSNAIASLLAEYCGISKTLDIPQLWSPVIINILEGKCNLASVIRKHPKPFSRDLIKEPLLSLIFDQVKQTFPQSRYVFISRDPRDNIRSILNRLGVSGNLKEFGSEQKQLPDGWSESFNPKVLRTNYTHYIDILAHRWNLITNVYLENRDDMILIRYEDFMQNKTGAIAALARILRLPAINDISEKVDIPYNSAGKDRDLPWETFFGSENLQRIERICGSRLEIIHPALDKLAAPEMKTP